MLRISTNAHTKRIIKNTRHIRRATQDATRLSLKGIQKPIKDFSRELMEDSKSGRDYSVYVSRTGRRLKRPRKHKASSRFEPFALMSGATIRSFGSKIKNWSMMEVGFGTVQAKVWENTNRMVLKRVIQNRRIYTEYQDKFEHNMRTQIQRRM